MKMREKLRALPPYTAPAMLFTAVWQFAVYELTKPFMDGRAHYDFTLPLDRATPFLPWTSLIYIGSFIFWVILYLYCGSGDKKRACRFFCADALAKGICLFFFILLPTTNVRPEITGHAPWDFVMRVTYLLDTPTNLFPSIHCTMSWLCYLGVRNEPRSSRALRAGVLLAALAIFLSTLTTKQHVFVDVLGGAALAQACYAVCAAPALPRAYEKMIDRLSGFAARRGGADRNEIN